METIESNFLMALLLHITIIKQEMTGEYEMVANRCSCICVDCLEDFCGERETNVELYIWICVHYGSQRISLCSHNLFRIIEYMIIYK